MLTTDGEADDLSFDSGRHNEDCVGHVLADFHGLV